MSTGQSQGPTGSGANTTRNAHRVEIECVAAGVIPSGALVALATANLKGTRVVVAPVAPAGDHRVRGIYIGVGGTGPADATYGGNEANAEDVIIVLKEGVHPYARVDGTPTPAADQDALTPSASVAGELESLGTTFDAGDQPMFICLEANASTVAPRAVMVSC